MVLDGIQDQQHLLLLGLDGIQDGNTQWRQIQGEAVNETETSVDTPKQNEDTNRIDDEAEQEDMVEDKNPDDVPSKKRILFNDFEARFGNIGYVMDITNDHNVISKVIEIMKNAAICSQ